MFTAINLKSRTTMLASNQWWKQIIHDTTLSWVAENTNKINENHRLFIELKNKTILLHLDKVRLEGNDPEKLNSNALFKNESTKLNKNECKGHSNILSTDLHMLRPRIILVLSIYKFRVTGLLTVFFG